MTTDTDTTTLPRFVVLTASTSAPRGARGGSYRRIAVVELEPGAGKPSMISERAKGVRRVVRTWERCYVGSTSRSAYAVALTDAEDLAAELNASA